MIKNIDISNKKVIIYGIGKIQRDFEYIFNDIKISYYIDDNFNDLENCKTVNFINKLDKISFIIIICKKEKDIAREKLLKYDLIYGKHFIYAEDYFYKVNLLTNYIGNKKIAVWGTGNYSHNFTRDYKKKFPELEIDYYIDNNKNKNEFLNKIVYHPSEIDIFDDLYIIVATAAYEDIKCQLIESGLKENTDFIYSVYVSEDLSELLSKTIFDTPQLKKKCLKPYGHCEVIDDGNVFLCCPGFLNLSIGNLKRNEFNEVWNSYIAKIIRLSIENGTYSFCNKENCAWLKYQLKRGVSCPENKVYSNNVLEKPYSITVSIDHSCNLSCPSCRNSLWVGNQEYIENQNVLADKLLRDVIPYAEVVWLAGDGEIFFSQIYNKILYDKRCMSRDEIMILSNGQLFNEKVLDKIKSHYESVDLIFSIDAATQLTYEKLRRGGKFNNIVKALEIAGDFRKNGKINSLGVNFVVQKENIFEMKKIVALCEKYNVDKLKFSKMFNMGNYLPDEFERITLFNKDNNINEEYKEIIQQSVINKDFVDYSEFAEYLDLEWKESFIKDGYTLW